ncbi:MAG: HEAT repeat domain-containing protein [Planctomycetota bacterium]
MNNLWAFPIPAKSKERMLKNALGDKAIQVRAAALRSLAKEQPRAKRLKNEIIASCQDEATDVRLAGLLCLAQLGDNDKDVESTVLEGLKDSEPRVRIAATKCMVALEILNEKTAKAVGGNLGDDTELLNSSLESLPKFGERAKPLIPSLTNLLKHPQERTRLLSIEALAAAGNDERQLTDRLKDSLEDDSWNVRQKTAETLSEFGGDAVAAVPQLFKLIDKEEDESFATAALREIDAAPADALPMLVEALKSENRRKQFYAVYLIGKMGADAEEVIPLLREELKDSKNSRNASSRRKYLSQAIESIEKAVREKQEAAEEKNDE